MVKDLRSTASKSSDIRKKSPARTKSPSRKAPAQKPTTVSKSTDEPVKELNKKSPVKSPSRTNSSPSRRQSPARTIKEKDVSSIKNSPKRKSPSRTIVGDTRVTGRKAIQQNVIDTELSGSEEEIQPKEKPKAAVRGRSRKLDLDDFIKTTISVTESTNSYGGEIRRLTRNSQAQEERVIHLKNYDSPSRKLGEFSDDELSLPCKPVAATSKQQRTSISDILKIMFQFFLTPSVVIGIYVFCDESKCSFVTLPNRSKFSSVSYFFDLQSLLGYSIVAVSLALLGTLPFGGRRVPSLPSKQAKFVYNCNGLFSMVVVLVTCAAVQYLWFPLSNFLATHILHLVVSALLFGVSVSIYLYLRSFYVPISALNPTEVNSSLVRGAFYGREVNPRFLNILDLKLYLLRIYSVSLILVDLAILVKGLNLDTKLAPAVKNLDFKPLLTAHPTLLVIVTLQLIYFVSHLVYESRLMSSYFVQYEPLGCANVVPLLLFPFQFTAQSKYVMEHRVHYALWELVSLCVLYLVGYILYTVSSNQKDSFRKNPYSAVSTKFESISTSQGKKILCSGLWGFVRQPNILGDILIHLALLRFGFEGPPVIGVILSICMLISRAVTSQNDSKNKYGTAWDKYCQKVKYVLVPKVY